MNSNGFTFVYEILSTLRACTNAEQAMWTMCHRPTIDKCLIFLQGLPDNEHRLPATPCVARLLLTGLLVHTHPSFVINATDPDQPEEDNSISIRNELSHTLISDAERLVETITNSNTNAFYLAFTTFQTTFEAWKRADREMLIQILVVSYCRLAVSIDELDQVSSVNAEDDAEDKERTSVNPDEDTDMLRNNILKSMADLEEKATKLGVSSSVFQTRIAATIPLPNDNECAEEIDQSETEQAWDEAVTSVVSTCKRAFWDVFTERVSSGDMEPLRIQLQEVMIKIKTLTPNRHDLHQDLDRCIDVDLVVQMAEHDALDTDTFETIANCLINRLLELQAPGANHTTLLWVDKWKTQWCDAKETYATLLPPFFASLHRDLDAAQMACDAIRQNIDLDT